MKLLNLMAMVAYCVLAAAAGLWLVYGMASALQKPITYEERIMQAMETEQLVSRMRGEW